MPRMNIKVGEPIDHKHGWSFNSKTKQYQVGNQLETLDPEFVLITNPSLNSWKHSVYQFCLEVMTWQVNRGKVFLVITPPGSGFAHSVRRYQLDSRKWCKLKMYLGCLHIDMTKYCRCDPSIKEMRVFFNYVDDLDLMEPEYAFNNEGKLWTNPQWKVLPSRPHFTEIVPTRDMRQNFLVEDLLEHFDDGALCGASMFLDRGAECSYLLQGLHHVETSIPVPLKHKLPQKFTTQLLAQTLRKIYQLPRSTEASVRESTDTGIRRNH